MIGMRSELRRRLLEYFVRNPEVEHSLRELARILDVDHGNLIREMARLEGIGLFQSGLQGRQRRYRLNRGSVSYREVKRAIGRMEAVVPALEAALGRIGRIQVAYLYGQYARRRYDEKCDLDLLIIGRPPSERISPAMRKLERRLRRKIHCTVLTRSEFAARRKGDDPVLSRFLRNRKIALVPEP
jgi:predicted nucleotidyltransferase